MVDNIAQSLILVFGVSANFLLNSKSSKSKYGPILGLCSQPFWLYLTFKNNQWGMFVLSFIYTVIWITGIKSFWFTSQKRGRKNDRYT